MFNPFPGLRPFEPNEDHLFFGREKEIDELLRRLRGSRFLAIIGSSGSGKSSLVRSGLIPSLRGGFMAGASPDWRVAILRPGVAPIAQLAAALDCPEVLGAPAELEKTNRVLIEATLLRSARGLVEAVRQARLPPDQNVLILVDQFEELFRFRRDTSVEESRDDAVGFVKLLLEASRAPEFSIYVVLTMRADFIGDCMAFPGLPEAVNSGQFLVPRMTRDQLRSAITGPVAVGGGKIAGRLVTRLLNDFGDEYDQLPILQHALMRTWGAWADSGHEGEIDLADYERIGSLGYALSRHADEAYEQAGSDEKKRLVEKVFRALTDTFTDPRGTRRPTTVAHLASICDATVDEVRSVIDLFRQPGRSFLTPPTGVELEAHCVVDISHESLMWCWTRLVLWAGEERNSAEVYARLSAAAQWYSQGRAGLWRNPELEVAKKWRIENHPNPAWARRHNNLFPQAMDFLDQSEAEWQRLSEQTKRDRERKLRQARSFAVVFAALSIAAILLAAYSWRQRQRAEANLRIATNAVDESLSAAGREQAREGSDLPQMEQFRKELLDKAESFYVLMVRQNPSAPALRTEQAQAHLRLGDIDRLLGRHSDAEAEYAQAIQRFTALAREDPETAALRQSLAYAHNWLGETMRDAAEKGVATSRSTSDVEAEYTSAIALQRTLCSEQPSNGKYKQELARSYYNRGIVRFGAGNSKEARQDFAAAIGILRPLLSLAGRSEGEDAADPRQDLARVYNNSAILVSGERQFSEARRLYTEAVSLAEELVKDRPANREYKAELATYAVNEARLLADADTKEAQKLVARALDLVEELSSPARSLTLKMAEVAQLRGQMLLSTDTANAKAPTDEALSAMQKLSPNSQAERSLFSAIYINVGANYLELAQSDLRLGRRVRARADADGLGTVLSHLSPDEQTYFLGPYKALKRQLASSPMLR